MGGRDVIAHIKDALASAHPGAVDDEVTEYVADMANELLAEGDLGRSPAEMAEELVDAAGPMLAEFIDDEAIKSLFDDAVAHHLGGGGSAAGNGSSADGGAQQEKKRYCLDLDGIILAFAGKVLLRPTSLKLERGKRYGMVGQNGAGKTTLLTRLAAGDINGFPPDIRCVFVQHEVLVTLEQTILAFMTSQASTLDANVEDVVPCLEAVGFTREMIEEKMVSELSGGWRMRLAIARAMLQKADLLLLDEPTNHLDVNAVEWLAGHLTSLPDTTTLVVSHDYDFLTDVATDIVHFEGQELTTFGGGFPGFRSQRPNLVLPRMKRDMVKAIEENAEAIGGEVDGGDIHDERQRESRERKSRLGGVELRGDLGSAASVRNAGGVGSLAAAMTSTSLSKSNAKDKPLITFPDPGQLDGVRSRSNVVLRVENLSFAYPGGKAPVLDDVNCRVYLNSRVAIVGANGAGKTTLLKNIVGELLPGVGSVWKHHNLRVSYIAQHSMHHLESNLQMAPKEYIQTRFFLGRDKELAAMASINMSDEDKAQMKVKGNVCEILGRAMKGGSLCYEVKKFGDKPGVNRWEPVEFLKASYVAKMTRHYDEKLKASQSGLDIRPLTSAEVYSHLADFGISQELADGKIKRMSGGQKSRLVLAAAMWTKPHVIALDEPTNYLDNETLQALTEALRKFKGGVLTVSHNAGFVADLCTDSWRVYQGKVTSTEEGGKAGKQSAGARRRARDAAKRAGGVEEAKSGVKDGKEDDDTAAEINGHGARMDDDVDRTVTGVLASRPTALDVKISQFSMQVNGQQLVDDCDIELNVGRRYGLLGVNGCGKSNLLTALANREVPVPEHVDVFHLREEAEPSDRTALEAVVDHIKLEVERLQKLEASTLATGGPGDERLQPIYERLEELDSAAFEARAAELLYGLGFGREMMQRATKDMSGGWRMRVALARALFAAPALLLLDEPTNHLDLSACVWLEHHLAKYDKCLLVISHSQDFLNGVCTHIVRLTNRKLKYYTGDYDTYQKTLEADNIIQQKKHDKEQADIKHLREFIASCGTYANMMKQANSKQKILDKMEAAGLTPSPKAEKTFELNFPDCRKLPPPVLPFKEVSFSYPGADVTKGHLLDKLEFGVDCDSRIALVGPNGAGKSTLLKLMTGDLTPSVGSVSRHTNLSIGRYHQHSVDVLDPQSHPIEFFLQKYDAMKKPVDEWRGYLGKYGISGRLQTTPIGLLSDGQKSRLVFAMICLAEPNLLLLDEPTNHLDIEAIDSLATAVNKYNGGLVLVSHDFRLIDQVAKEIWVCENGGVTVWKDDIRAYKRKLAKAAGL
jgi:ATP-binding cassette subfamily F protein 2